MSELGVDTIRYALQVARDRGLRKVQIRAGDSRFSATLDPEFEVQELPMDQVFAIVEEMIEDEVGVQAPAVGYTTDLSLKVGSHVKEGDVVAVITALGLPNEVYAPITGEIRELKVKSGDPVEYGQTLLLIKRVHE